MSPVRTIALPARWLGLRTEAVEEVPCFSIYLANERIGEARMTLTDLGTNPVRTLYLGCFETSLGELALLVEVPPINEDSDRISRENVAACMALDAVRYEWESGAESILDVSTGHWRVTLDGVVIADGASREDAIRIGHAQVRA